MNWRPPAPSRRAGLRDRRHPADGGIADLDLRRERRPRPLVVMSVGLLAGSLPGAIMGFGTGLLVDTVLVQTLGVTSLLYIAIGYWSGRLRELRDPAHGLVPLAAGAAATAVVGIGMTLIQFLLGVDAPVSFLLAQQIFVTVLVNTLLALPVYALVRRIDPARRCPTTRAAGAAAPTPPAALVRSRARPSASASFPGADVSQPPEDRRPPLTPQLALRVAVVGSFALAMFAIIFFRLWFLQVLSGHSTWRRRRPTGAQDRIAAPRGEIMTATASCSWGRPRRWCWTSSRPSCESPRAQRALYRRLAEVLQMSTKRITRARCGGPTEHDPGPASPDRLDVAQQVAVQPYADASDQGGVSRTSSSTSPSARTVPRRPVSQISVPSYPQGTLAAQLLGTVGRITARSAGEPPSGGAAASARPGPTAGCQQRGHRPGRPGGLLRPLPARHRRLRSGPGQRLRPAHGRTSVSKPIRGTQPGAVARRQPRARRPAGAYASIQSNPGAPAAPSWR